ncbi:Ras GTPase activating protein, putative [Entamoeba invadens IP1]|uniref:Ras GTPase activating protein, putative n=1 Tax=Entamoeba invadens IP1 TaxID=370355 RepID=A0A0A1UDC7_ENTIV|nr:Ras GTPase activating protein, putative [Entamoeba invadens IP1]ELP94349.1 Ras GTPase activating protein, putative [Entamoeba invadens IP1]|eukprot:XP_004261120.1 Ras GTPase activating protein, putative [Entamoeba invadens IP1]
MSQEQTIVYEKSDIVGVHIHYESVVNELMFHLPLTIYVGNVLPPELQDPFVKIITELLITFGKVVPCTSLMIDEEFKVSTSEGTLFRSNTFCSRVMTYYARISCRSFLRQTLKNVINEINSIPTLFELDSIKNPNLTPTMITKNFELLQAYTTKFIRSIENNISSLPMPIFEIFKKLFEMSKKHYPDSTLLPYTMVGGFLFLRVICPAITTPESSGIETEVPITSPCRRNLILITKILQNIANNISTFKEDYLKVTISFTTQMSTKINQLIEKMCTKAVDLPPQPFPQNSIDSIDRNNLFELHSILLKAASQQKEPPKDLQVKSPREDIKKLAIIGKVDTPSSQIKADGNRRTTSWLAAKPTHIEKESTIDKTTPRLMDRPSKSTSSGSPITPTIITPVASPGNSPTTSESIDCCPFNEMNTTNPLSHSTPSSTNGSINNTNGHSTAQRPSPSAFFFQRQSSEKNFDRVTDIAAMADSTNPYVPTSPRGTNRTSGWTRTSVTRRSPPQFNALCQKNVTKQKDDEKDVKDIKDTKEKKPVHIPSQYEMYTMVKKICIVLGPSPLFMPKKLGQRINIDVEKDEFIGFIGSVVEKLKLERAVYIEKAQDGSSVVYVILLTLMSIFEADEKVKDAFDSHWGEISLKIIEGLVKYTLLFDLTGVTNNLKETFLKCVVDRKSVFTAEQRKNVKRVILFHANKKVKKVINTVQKMFETKAIKKLLLIDTCVELENILGVSNVFLPESSVSFDRRVFVVIKINKKQKSQTRILRFSLAWLCNVDQTTNQLINTIDLDAIERVELKTSEAKMSIEFKIDETKEKRLYQFSSVALMEKALYELYAIFLIRKRRDSSFFTYTVKKCVVDLAHPLNFAKSVFKKDCQLSITLKTIMIVEMMGIRDIEIASLIKVEYNEDKKVVIVWKDVGCEEEVLEFERFEHCDDFINIVNDLMAQYNSPKV